MMNKDILKGNWKQIKGKIQEKWGKLTDDELKEIDGKREALIGKLQTKYGYAKDKAQKEVENFERTCQQQNQQGQQEEQEEFAQTDEWGKKRRAG